MIQNQRPYQLVFSKTGSAAFAAPIAVGARICGLGLGILASLLPERRMPIGDESAVRAEAERLFPRPEPSPERFPPLPPCDPEVEVSVIVPAHNAERYITECIDSVLTQAGGHRVQLIAVNDNSVDRTCELLSRYRDLPDVILPELHRGGSAARARNEGLLHAVGRYILFLDSDDVLAPGAIDSLLSAAERLGADVVQGGWQYIDEGGTRGASQRYADAVYEGNCRADRFDLPGMPWGKLYRRELFSDIRFPPAYSCCEDTIIHFLIFRRAQRVASVRENVYFWRQNPRGITAVSQNTPRALQSYWIVGELLDADARLGLPRDGLFLRSLVMQLSGFLYSNVAGLDESAQRAVFRLCCAMYARLVTGAGAGVDAGADASAGADADVSVKAYEGSAAGIDPRGLPLSLRLCAHSLRTCRFREWQRLGRLFQLMM